MRFDVVPPADDIWEAVRKLIVEELESQSRVARGGLYFDPEGWPPNGVILDGEVDLSALARAITAKFDVRPL